MARDNYGGVDSFAQAVAFISASAVSSSSETKLRIYALYKIATTSPRPSTSRPGVFDFTARAKWDSWSALGNGGEYEGVEGQEKAKSDYEEVARGLGWMGEEVEGEPVVPVERKKEGGGGMVSVSRMAPEEPPGGATPSRLHDLAVDGKLDDLREFLSWDGAASKVNERDAYGFTPLHLSSDRGNLEIVKLLLASGADISLEDDDGQTALQLSQEAGHVDIARLLEEATP